MARAPKRRPKKKKPPRRSAPRAFDLLALYNAMDAKRAANGSSWAQVTAEINALFAGTGARMAQSTIRGVGTRRVVEADGVLQMLRWLGRSPESFVPNDSRADAPEALLPDVPSDRILRFNTPLLHAALNAIRMDRQLTWEQLAKRIKLNRSTLAGYAHGSRTSFPDVMRAVHWLDKPAALFTYAAER
jgi:hypothetical protein